MAWSRIALAASSEFGVPVMDLGAVTVDLDVVRIVSEELLNKHRVLPLSRRGKRLFVGVSDPTNLQAIDEIKFATGLSVEAIVVEDDKLAEQVSKAIEALDTTSFDSFDDDDLDLVVSSETIQNVQAATSSRATKFIAAVGDRLPRPRDLLHRGSSGD